MSLFKPKKQDRGDYTAFVSIKGEQKMKAGEPVFEEIETDVIDKITGLKVIKTVPVIHKYNTLNIVKNYPEGEEPADIKDKESYFFFSSNSTKEADWICKNKETKKVLGEFDYSEEEKKFIGKLGEKKFYIPVADENERVFQVYPVIEGEDFPF